MSESGGTIFIRAAIFAPRVVLVPHVIETIWVCGHQYIHLIVVDKILHDRIGVIGREDDFGTVDLPCVSFLCGRVIFYCTKHRYFIVQQVRTFSSTPKISRA